MKTELKKKITPSIMCVDFFNLDRTIEEFEKNGVELIRTGYSTAFWVGFAVLGCIMSFCLQGLVDYPLMSPKLICNFMMLIGITERVIHLYSGREIAMRRALRKRLRKKTAKPTRV